MTTYLSIYVNVERIVNCSDYSANLSQMNDPYNYRNALPTPPPMSGDTGHRFFQLTTMSHQLCSCHGIPQWRCQHLAWNSTQNTGTSVRYPQQGVSANPAYDMG